MLIGTEFHCPGKIRCPKPGQMRLSSVFMGRAGLPMQPRRHKVHEVPHRSPKDPKRCGRPPLATVRCTVFDFSALQGPLGNEDEFRKMNIEADKQGIKIIADVVLNHMIDVRDMEGDYRDFVIFDGNKIVSEKFPQFSPNDFHRRCHLSDNEITCWLDNSNADLKTESPHVRHRWRRIISRNS